MKIWKSSGGSHSNRELDHQQLGALLNNMSDGVLSIDKAGLITLSNSVALNLLDTNVLTGRNLIDVFKPLDKAGQAVDVKAAVLANTSALSSSDWKLQYSDGSMINLYFSASPVKSGFGSSAAGGFVLLFRDITREKSIEEEREEFVSVASHELRTPVAIAEGNISNAILLAQRSKTSDAIQQTLEAAHEQTVFLSNLINDLSMLSRAERGNLALSVETISVPELVGSLIHDYSPQAQKQGLTLQSNLSPDLTTINTSKLYVREVLQNFITNALKYTEKGSITIAAEKLNEGTQFSVIDTGIGISKSEQNKLFGKFFRSNDWRVKKINGTGLGLYITSKLARLIGANIEMDSELNKGSTFRIFVPNIEAKAPKT